MNSSLFVINDCPESEIEDIVCASCPCGYMTFDSGEQLQTSRLCRSNSTNGAQWKMAYLSSCNFIDGPLSICQIAIVRLVIFVLIACLCYFSALFLSLGVFSFPYQFLFLVIARIPLRFKNKAEGSKIGNNR